VEAIRLLRVARAGAVKAHTAALNQLRELLVTAPAPLRQHIQAQRRSLQGRVGVCARLRPDLDRLANPTHAAKLALRAVAERALELDRQASQLNQQLTRLVGRAAPRTTALLGISTSHVGQLLVTAGQNLDRLRSEAAFAHLCVADPIPASSGKTMQDPPAPAQPRRGPRRQHGVAPDRSGSPAPLRPHPRLRHQTAGPGPLQAGDHPLLEALHRQAGLLHPPSRPGGPHRHLTIYRNVPGRFTRLLG
jgi:transposase